ncbi:hypothetical protein [Janibacter melonis]|uniref:hypothetical protein n=1 Tax=Janibacter melonis TaxID=262209 RepID=UPI00178264BE|nr:hypothetical protein [Janibacter melonis]
MVLVLLVTLAPPAGADTVIPTDRSVVGGCLVRFDAAGRPSLSATQARPCIGARAVSISATGDVVVSLTPGADAPQARLMLSADSTLAGRGILAGATRVGSSIAIRLYDDRRTGRIDLRRADHRSRVRSGGVSIGWVATQPARTNALDPGVDAYGRYRDRLVTDDRTVVGGCVIRFNANGPWIHANPTHHCTGARRVGISADGRVELTFSDEQRASVITLTADPDETLISRGVVAGATASTRTLYVRLYDTAGNRALDLRRSADRIRVAGSMSNMWLSWTKSAGRPGLINASTDPATDRYGPYVHGSATPGSVRQAGCQVRFSASGAEPYAYEGPGSTCTGVAAVSVDARGRLVVTASARDVQGVIATTAVSSRALTDYGIRAGASGGGWTTSYVLRSTKLDRSLDLRRRSDRELLRRSGSLIEIGWSRPAAGR